ncbi:uncharacterized protein [Mycetomoellerius zeteki]|uniref:uncharacterized protein n=1 Tax=Mycetomoellerius zeteki TaxID=64791 RepID=UPI00084E7AD2|nr:PREDICTED: uncharacterized protein LOC108729370 [Trachymyrmex zeteki]
MQFTYFRLGTLCIQIVLRRRYDNYAKSKSRVAVAYRRETLIAHASAARAAGSRYLRQDSDISRALYDKQLFWLSQSYGLGRRLANLEGESKINRKPSARNNLNRYLIDIYVMLQRDPSLARPHIRCVTRPRLTHSPVLERDR